MQEQKIAALVQELWEAKGRVRALEDSASVHEGDYAVMQTGLEDARQAGRCLAEQLAAQTATVAALEDQMAGLKRCMAARDAEIDKVYEQLRVAQRELDQSRRESAAQVKVRGILFALYSYCY